MITIYTYAMLVISLVDAISLRCDRAGPALSKKNYAVDDERYLLDTDTAISAAQNTNGQHRLDDMPRCNVIDKLSPTNDAK